MDTSLVSVVNGAVTGGILRYKGNFWLQASCGLKLSQVVSFCGMTELETLSLSG